MRNKFQKVLSIIFIVAVLFSSFQVPGALAQAQDGLKRQINAGTGRVSFIGPESGHTLSAFRALGTFLRPRDPALALVNRFGPEFGLNDPARELSEIKTSHSVDGRVIVRYQQNHQGIPVMGGELIVNTNNNGDLYSMNGEVSSNLSLPTQPKIDSAQATQAALQAIAKYYQKKPVDFVATNPELWIFDKSLLQPGTQPVELVWRMEVTLADKRMPVRELVLVNAQKGGISLHFNQIDTAWVGLDHSNNSYMAGSPAGPGNQGTECSVIDQGGVTRPVGRPCENGVYESRALLLLSPHVNTYTAGDTSSLPGSFLCNQTQPNCTNGSDSHADAAHQYAIGTYNFYASNFLRDSIDNNAMVINSTVHYCDPIPFFGCPYANAFWSGSQMVYGDAYGFPLADDVVAHELTHGVTQYESNLFYYYQSGAINESFSDLWGEYYDQSNGQGNEDASVKWQIGEDVSGLGALRSMSDPTAFGDPDKMSSANYFQGTDDNGGVHYNSGINNKAAYLMVNGGTFNGRTVSALGWDKTGVVYYEANINLLSSGADYSDLYYALQQACKNLIGQKGITSGTCVEVRDALDAVEMNGQPAPNFNTDAPFCDNGKPPSPVFFDNLESGTGNWVFGALTGTTRWQYDSPDGPFAHSGLHSLYAADSPAEVTDTYARLKNPILIPPQAFLRFDHAFGFEDIAPNAYDGGILEYSTNGGGAWQSASPLFMNNGYNGTIKADELNPLAGKSAFVMDSHGYISSRLNLQSLANQSVLFRWRMGLDPNVSDLGWWVDDVQIYICNVPLGRDTVGVLRPSNGALYLKNSNTSGFADVAINYGLAGDYSVVGDWDGNGTDTIGVYRNGVFYLRNSNTLGFADLTVAFGSPGDQPIAGDWNGDGADTIGVYRRATGQFLLSNNNTSGVPEMSFYLGNVGDVGIAGDWNGDGMDTTGVFRPSNGVIFLKNTNVSGFADVALNYGLPGDQPVVGDWDNNGTTTIGIYRNARFYLRNSNTNGFADILLDLGNVGDMPIAGDWDNLP